MENILKDYLDEAIQKARYLCHPDHIGMTENDRKETKAYQVALENVHIKLLESMPEFTKKIVELIDDCIDYSPDTTRENIKKIIK